MKKFICLVLALMLVVSSMAALAELPDKAFETDGRVPLCRVVASGGFDYCPRDPSVKRVWLNDDNELCFSEYTAEEDEGDVYTWTEDDDMLDITDFGYLIDQIAEKVQEDKTVNLINRAVVVAGMVPELDLKAAIDREI
jgi:hypothetical protein